MITQRKLSSEEEKNHQHSQKSQDSSQVPSRPKEQPISSSRRGSRRLGNSGSLSSRVSPPEKLKDGTASTSESEMFPELNRQGTGRRKSSTGGRSLPDITKKSSQTDDFRQIMQEMENVDLTPEERKMILQSASGPQDLAAGKVRRVSNPNRADTLSRNHPFFKLLLNRKSNSRVNLEELKSQMAEAGISPHISPVHAPNSGRQPSLSPHPPEGFSNGPPGTDRELKMTGDENMLVRGLLESEMYGMQRIVLKFTTVSEGSEPSAFIVDRKGVRIGRGAENKVSIPSDTTMRVRDHARIDYDETEGAFRLVDLGNRHGAAIRIPVGSGMREWPLKESSAFSAGNSVFVVSSVDCVGTSKKTNGTEAEGETSVKSSSAASTDPALFLEVTSGPLRGERRRIGREGATLGRATDNLISIADKELSRRHSLVEYDEHLKNYFLCDVGSTNGTYMQLVGPYANSYKLTFSDHILVGRTGFSINRFDYGVSEEIGRRPNMEDKSIIIQDLGIEHLYQMGLGPQSFVAVYDGHGGPHASNYLWRHLHINVSETLENVGKDILEKYPDGLTTIPPDVLDENIKRMITECFNQTDEHYINNSDHPQCGSTATTALIIGNRFYNFNVGDSRTILCRGGKVRLVSQDHKPSREDETERIKKAGGFVIHKRVMGELAVSRAFGDKEFKMGLQAILNEDPREQNRNTASEDREQMLPEKPLITAEPEILTTTLNPEDDFIVLACDGIFDVMSNEEVADLINQEMVQHGDTQRAVEMLSHVAIHKRRTRDNVTIVLVCLRKWW